MFKVKLYKYDSTQEDNGYRGTGENDFSPFVLQAHEQSEDITQILDTSEITLVGLPFQQAFDPETKFILDVIEVNDLGVENIVSTTHWIVSRDTPEQPILSDNHYFNHHLSFIEPSAVAQKRLVDNIAVTYKLKDVSLQELPAFPIQPISFTIESGQTTPPVNFVATDNYGVFTTTYEFCVGKYFTTDGQFSITNSSGEIISDVYNNLERFRNSDGTYTANFTLPKIKIMYGIKGTKNYQDIGAASISYSIKEFSLNDQYNPTKVYSGNIISNDNLGGYTRLANAFPVWFDKIDGEWLYEGATQTITNAAYGDALPTFYYRKYTNTDAPNPDYTIRNIPISGNMRYVVEISLYQFPDNIPRYTKDGVREIPTQYEKLSTNLPSSISYVKSSRTTGSAYSARQTLSPFQNKYLTSRQTGGELLMVAYVVENKSIVYASATPYSALSLLQKAIINSGLYEKTDGVYIADINKSDVPFYIDSDFVDELSSTLIIENFYNQKNLWEVMVEVGNYIHSIPEIRFGENDKFMITFNRLGITKQSEDSSTHMSIFNSRSIEDYISATSSYISNMVQLGGYIEEWVAPKTSSETLLVSNDTASIVVSKPIIELLEVTVRRNSDGLTADLTPFIYEENVYKTLDIDYKLNPNRGISMFYRLGTNEITGGDYQLPQANTNIYSDYAFKKIIYCAYNGYVVVDVPPTSGYWTRYNINDYSFRVRYRTKDSVRQSHIRPDIRKYLLSNKWDRYPEHNQFNNQTDVVVDSIKFGNNMAGKLIKTGNNAYEITEWNSTYGTVKHKGELYRINNELYYVAKVKHTIYNSMIVSVVSYSKDYNELSNIIGIPSEPRFYEISEQSLIWREFEINDMLYLTDEPTELSYHSNYLFNFSHLGQLLLGEGTDFAKYAVTVFKGDKDANTYDQTVGQSNLYIEVINPINAYSSANTLTYEYDMIDNYSAGDMVKATEQIDTSSNIPNKGSYNTLKAVKYTDIYGRAALMDFYILGDIGNLNPTQISSFPESPISTKNGQQKPFIGNYDILATNVKEYNTDFNGRGLGLLKDCREAISVNYNLRLATSSDTFVISPYVFLPNKSNLKVVLLSNEVNKLSSGYINNAEIITPTDANGNTMSRYFDVQITPVTQTNEWNKEITSSFYLDLASIFEQVNEGHFNGNEEFVQVKGIAVLCDVSLSPELGTENPALPYKTQFIIARNIPQDWDKTKALKSWNFGAPNKDVVFDNRQ